MRGRVLSDPARFQCIFREIVNEKEKRIFTKFADIWYPGCSETINTV